MAIVGFNYSKIDVHKNTSMKKGKISINNNVAIKGVEEKTLPFGTGKDNAIKFSFEFTTSYDPSLGKILLGGEILYLGDAPKLKAISEEWKKSKKLPKEVMSEVLNAILSKCNIQALILSQEVNLPPPIPLPKVRVEQGKK